MDLNPANYVGINSKQKMEQQTTNKKTSLSKLIVLKPHLVKRNGFGVIFIISNFTFHCSKNILN